MNRKLVQFAKWPREGRVKTRIAKIRGDKEALAIHMELLLEVYANLSKTDADFEIHFDYLDQNSSFWREIARWDANPYLQRGSDLGERMAHVLLTSSRNAPIVIVGSDCPTVTADVVDQAYQLLDSNDIVLGPAEDGGYVLIGASRFLPQLFDEVEWGGGMVLNQTISNAAALGLQVAQLPMSWDVDTDEDYRRWKAC